MIKIDGLDKLSRNLEEAKEALSAIDGDLGTVSFDPEDPASIEAAIQQVEHIVDDRLGQYASNPIIGPLAEDMKDKYREGILEKAAAARLQKDQSDGQ
jgi:predicted DNA-binding transcriptional regulator YafY